MDNQPVVPTTITTNTKKRIVKEIDRLNEINGGLPEGTINRLPKEKQLAGAIGRLPQQ